MMHCAHREVNIPLQSQQVQPMLTHAGMATIYLHQMHKLEPHSNSCTRERNASRDDLALMLHHQSKQEWPHSYSDATMRRDK